MCGIIGYTGKGEAAEILINGLSRLEYRGYDSAGVAILKDGELLVRKKKGKLSVLREELSRDPLFGVTGVGHTRWATHGVPNDVNAHPHIDDKTQIAVVHNGIIENYQELKEKLIKKGYVFRSDTDSEVIAHLIAEKYKGDLCQAVIEGMNELKGSFALAVVHKGEPGRVIGARRDSPLIVGLGNGENFVASDIPAILERTKRVVYLDNDEAVDLFRDKATFYNNNGSVLDKDVTTIEWDISQAEKGGYRHFMLKEIFEQPTVLNNILKERIRGNEVEFAELKIEKKTLAEIKNIAIIACGTAYHAGLTGKYMIEKIARVPVWVDTSSEFRYRNPLVDKDTLVIVISQSGETADTLAALREARNRGSKVLAVCNVLGSSIAREADGVIYTHAGPEIAVASTKAYTAQIAALCLFTYYLADIKCTLKEQAEHYLKELKRLPSAAERMLKAYKSEKNVIASYAEEFHQYYLARNNKSCFLYLGRNINYPNALEGALKLKEISYISAEGYPAGEMKHGPIALIDENPWVVCIAPESETYDKMLSNIQEIKARGGIVIAVVSEGDRTLKCDRPRMGIHEATHTCKANCTIEIPRVDELFSPILVAIPLQLLAYHVADEFGYDIDQPRNLAKSVTVE
ncbi:MAG: glutamine--fructose-6-phosphate transaminase (isomerizing) [Candidatus Omnitrophica bacterium]|nr:glutamine--fructose-6-phosphate transaminase (isomerizing) [Candidatus Omnitrophota bacterium]MDD5488727.1 glutamine--fructose-6-phosphate transaminase (isomerizing) [Candidatus Omnitrophota bacterium]